MICGGAYFKGKFKLGNGHYCYPLAVPDHTSRASCSCAKRSIPPRTVCNYCRDRGLPPGSNSLQQQDGFDAFAHEFNAERFHRSLKAEVLSGPPLADLAAAERAFDRWRNVYNSQRPHEALQLAVPASRLSAEPARL